MFDFLFNPNGRVSRKGIWLGLYLPQLALGVAALMIDAAALGAAIAAREIPPLGLASGLVTLFFFWPNIAVSVKRFHDRGMSGWWVLWFLLILLAGLAFALMDAANAVATGAGGAGMMLGVLVVVVAGLVQFVMLYLLPGQQGANAHGPDPRGGSGRPVDISETNPDWAQRLEPNRMAAAARAAPPQPTRAINWPTSAGARGAFGRRGL
jgi:uncharacterized membrane protein YhaH (DUF805 family)